MGEQTEREALATDAEWKQATDVLGAVSALLGTVDWTRLVRSCQHAGTVGPFVDPTAFLGDGFDRLRRNERLASATAEYLARLHDVVEG